MGWLRCVGVVVGRPFAWLATLLTKSSPLDWEFRLAQAIDPASSCWITRYLHRLDQTPPYSTITVGGMG